jgi:hypothetical protein
MNSTFIALLTYRNCSLFGLTRYTRFTRPSLCHGFHSKTNLFESLGVEASERIVLCAVTDLDWVAADFTVFDIDLTAN